jgi:hypothetical protein
MYLKKGFILILFVVLGYISIYAQKAADTTNKYIIMRIVESDFLGLKPVIYIYEAGNLTEIELKLPRKEREKETFKIAASKINEILMRGYKIISSTSGAASADTMNSFLTTTYVFEKL